MVDYIEQEIKVKRIRTLPTHEMINDLYSVEVILPYMTPIEIEKLQEFIIGFRKKQRTRLY